MATLVRRPDIPALTSLRYFAALWVVFFHLREIGLWKGGPAPYRAFAQLGYLGVGFFFVLSGFILVYVYAGQEIARSRFWQARFARIYPAYLFSLLVTLPGLLQFLPFARKAHVVPLVLTAYPLLLEAWFPKILLFWNPVAWSLSVEAFFYLVFPFALRRLQTLTDRQLRLCIAAFWAASLLVTGAYVVLRPDGVAHTTTLDNQLFWLGVVKLNPIVRLPEFLLGMGVGLAFLRLPSTRAAAVLPATPSTPSGRLDPAAPPSAWLRAWPIAAGALAILVSIVFQQHIPFPMLHSGLLAPAFALIILGFASLPAHSLVYRLLATRSLILLGESSYSLYLLHAMPIAIMTFVLHLANSPHIHAIVLTYLVAITLVAIAVFLFIENPARRLLRPRSRARSTAPASTRLAATP